jgi:hypothetical protein
VLVDEFDSDSQILQSVLIDDFDSLNELNFAPVFDEDGPVLVKLQYDQTNT